MIHLSYRHRYIHTQTVLKKLLNIIEYYTSGTGVKGGARGKS